jgi:alpha-L-arabinofuranosidase
MRAIPYVPLLCAAVLTTLSGRCGAQSPAAPGTATITVNAATPGPRVSPLLYGIFFEEINHAGDGGIFAELVRNRSFEDGRMPEAWDAFPGTGASGSLALDTSRPLNNGNKTALRLDINTPGDGYGAANTGYWGIATTKGASYRYSLYARAGESYKGGLIVRLVDKTGKLLGESRVRSVGPNWQEYKGTLKASETVPDARLVVAGNAVGSVFLDMVSLFPKDTWKGRENGLRKDLAQMVANLKPGFIRFPGGCFVEGDRMANAWRWKETIGDPAERIPNSNLWGYKSSNGLGYHEYLQMCEDFGAEPLFVVNCGMSHNGVVPMDQIDSWVQDALDALEYANGPVTSKWGALRAKHGHPKPYKLRFLEVGNENGGPAYNERYARFYDAIRAKYPEVQIIAGEWGGRPSSRPVPILDVHGYHTPEWFAARAKMYDKADRNGPKIYFGEYAATEGVGRGNLKAAVGEAAFMTGLERNADHVIMGSYAPLFVNVNDRKWNPDAINFDAARAYGTPSYYVQQMFGQNRSDIILPTTVNTAAPLTEIRGGIGLATWSTQAEFKDITVTQGTDTILLREDFTSGVDKWRVVRGDWKVQDGAYRQSGNATDLRAVTGDPNWKNYTISLKARKVSGAEGFLIMFGARNDNDWYWWNIGGWNNTQHAIEKSEGGWSARRCRAMSSRIAGMTSRSR